MKKFTLAYLKQLGVLLLMLAFMVSLLGPVNAMASTTNNVANENANEIKEVPYVGIAAEELYAVQDVKKRDIIAEILEPTYITVSDDFYSPGESEQQALERSTAKIIDKLSKLSCSELNEKLKSDQAKTAKLVNNSDEAYFLDDNQEIVTGLPKYELNEPRTLNTLDDANLVSLMSTETSATKSYSRSTTVYYKCAEGVAYSLAAKISWKAKNKKIIKYSSKASTWTNGLWSRKYFKKTSDAINSRGFGHIVYTAKFQHNVGVPVTKTIKNGAWYYGDGGCDWN